MPSVSINKMGCKGSKQLEVENTYGELNKNIQKTTMLRAGLNLGESSYGIQVGLSRSHKRDFTASGYERPPKGSKPMPTIQEEDEDLVP